jgi:hypothetical protein
MPDVPGTTLNSSMMGWLDQLFQNRATRALPMFTYNSNVQPMLTPQGILQSPSLPGVYYGRPDMPQRANQNINPARPLPGQYSQTPPILPPSLNSNIAASGPLPFMAPQMVGHPTGLRDREKSILSQFEDE